MTRCLGPGVVVLFAALGGAAQQEPTPQPASAAVTAAERQRAEALLTAHEEQSLGLRALVADYAQRRTTELAKEPLLSRGEFVFVRDPGVVMWRASAPRVSITRLTATTYEVLRPQKQQLERFLLEGPELSAGLFAVLGGDRQRLLAEFDLVGCSDDAAAGRSVLRLVPKVAAMRERLRELAITFAGDERKLLGVAYVDRSGDRIEIELTRIRRNPAPSPSADLEVPPGTAVIEHGSPKPTAPPPRQAKK
jgi:hypothetical protein